MTETIALRNTLLFGALLTVLVGIGWIQNGMPFDPGVPVTLGLPDISFSIPWASIPWPAFFTAVIVAGAALVGTFIPVFGGAGATRMESAGALVHIAMLVSLGAWALWAIWGALGFLWRLGCDCT